MSEFQFFQWAGYLSNPVRRARVDVELHPRKEREFRYLYFSLTGVLLRAAKDEPSFVVLKQDADKRGVQQRIYFSGEQNAMPPRMNGITERKASGKLSWRINSKGFVSELFKYGFLIGDNSEREAIIRNQIPQEFLRDFDIGFNHVNSVEQAEMLVYQHYANEGTRTLPLSVMLGKWDGTEPELNNALDNLLGRGVIHKHSDEKMITFNASPATVINNEIVEPAMRHAIGGETHVEKREYLIETYARNHGWKKLAKKTFGTRCMCNQCSNTFIKNDNIPYIEVHHIVPLHAGGEDGIWNLSVLCAHHHRMAHFARTKEKEELKEFLLQKNRAMQGVR